MWCREEKIIEYITNHIHVTEKRIPRQMEANCLVALIIPVYGERARILNLLLSLSSQKSVNPDQFEVIFVINNPSCSPEKAALEEEQHYAKRLAFYNKAVKENCETLWLLECFSSPSFPDVRSLPGDEINMINKIKKAGIRIHYVDKATPGNELLPHLANVGGARNRGTAEAVERFFTIKRDGIIAHSDGDVVFDRCYMRNLINAFEKEQGIAGITGKTNFIIEDYREVPLFEKAALYSSLDFLYRQLVMCYVYRETGFYKEQSGNSGVRFTGANMAARMSATVLAGGIAPLAGGEDSDFGHKLAEEGKILFDPAVVVNTARRISLRINHKASHGQKTAGHYERVADGKPFMVENYKKTMLFSAIEVKLQNALKNGAVSPAGLKSIFACPGSPLLSDAELHDLCRIPAGCALPGILPHNVFKEKLQALVMPRAAALWPAMEIETACNSLLAEITGIRQAVRSAYQKQYRKNRRNKNREIRKRIANLKSCLQLLHRQYRKKNWAPAGEAGELCSFCSLPACVLEVLPCRKKLILENIQQYFRLYQSVKTVKTVLAGLSETFFYHLSFMHTHPLMILQLKIETACTILSRIPGLKN